jgi:hypothetical protein
VRDSDPYSPVKFSHDRPAWTMSIAVGRNHARFFDGNARNDVTNRWYSTSRNRQKQGPTGGAAMCLITAHTQGHYSPNLGAPGPRARHIRLGGLELRSGFRDAGTSSKNCDGPSKWRNHREIVERQNWGLNDRINPPTTGNIPNEFSFFADLNNDVRIYDSESSFL